MVVLLTLHGTSHAGNYTWTGSAGKSWDNPNNWSPSGTPGATDTVTIGSGSDTILINANTTINRLVMNGRVINNGVYQLEITQRASLNGGKIYNGTLKLRGVFAFFQGTNTNCTIDCVVNQIKFSGGTFSGRDSVLLDSIANLSLYAHGLPVQMARNILDLELYDSPGGGSRMAQPVKVKRETGPLLLIPNPAKQSVRLVVPSEEKIDQVLVFDNTGRLVEQQRGVYILEVTTLLNGIYQVQVKTNIKSRQGKLVIIK